MSYTASCDSDQSKFFDRKYQRERERTTEKLLTGTQDAVARADGRAVRVDDVGAAADEARRGVAAAREGRVVRAAAVAAPGVAAEAPPDNAAALLVAEPWFGMNVVRLERRQRINSKPRRQQQHPTHKQGRREAARPFQDKAARL